MIITFSPLRTLIVEEHTNARLLLKRMIQQLCAGKLEIVAEAATVEEALTQIRETSPQLVFLDVLLPDGTGFDILDSFQHHSDFGVIFVTGFSEYAIRAIRYGAIDYLLKPLSLSELSDALQRAFSYFQVLDDVPERIVSQRIISSVAQRKAFAHIDALALNGSAFTLSKISLPTTKGTRIVDVKDVLYCEAQSNYTLFVFTDSSRLLVSKTMRHFEAMLLKRDFIRVHRSFMVNPAHIVGTSREQKLLFVVLSNALELPVSEKYSEEFLKMLPS